ncbi:MAG: prepilin-type N-terminal cleavage/methylation domain-containing protein [Pseudomonadales bacterium]|nr:prepilin-type N-terminal cleavage/methylation domain-containing protein [Pseudomonadales bacterium]
MNSTYSKGITFIELLVAISVLAITASFAMPSFKGYIKDRRIDETAHHIRDSLKLARSNAVKGDGGRLIPDAADGWDYWEVQDSDNNIVFKSQSASRIKVTANKATVDTEGNIARGSDSVGNTEEIQFSTIGALKIRNNVTVSSLRGVVFDVCSEGEDSSGKQIFVSQLGWVNTETCDCSNEVCN